MQLLETSYRKKSGIYKITNLINGKFYIGSAKSLYDRCLSHRCKLDQCKHRNKHLERAYYKYDKENFKFEIIEYCDIEQLIIREQYYLDNLNPEYNIRKIANSNLGLKMSEEAKEKISKANLGKIVSEETKRKLSISKTGLKRSKEAIENQRLKMIGRKHSEESINKMNLIAQRFCKKVDQLDMDNNHIASFESIKEASIKTGIPRSCISRCISGSRNHTYNFKWRITNGN